MHTTTHTGDFETAFSLFTALEATAELWWFDPEQQMALMEGFDDFSGHDAGQVITLLDVDFASPAEAQEALTRLADLLRILSHEAAHLNIALRYTRALTPSNSSGRWASNEVRAPARGRGRPETAANQQHRPRRRRLTEARLPRAWPRQLIQAVPTEHVEDFAQRRDLLLAVRRATAGLHHVVPRPPRRRLTLQTGEVIRSLDRIPA